MFLLISYYYITVVHALACLQNFILASNADREGEAIAWSIKEMLE